MRILCLIIASAVGFCSVAAAATPDPCAVIPTSQVRSWFGKDVVSKPARGGPQEEGCQWLPKDGSPGGLAVMFGPAGSYSPPTHRLGYKALPGIGDKAYIVPVQGGWEAGALKGGKSVWTRSPNLSNKIAPALLKMTVAKLSPMHLFPPSICLATALLGYCGPQGWDPPKPPPFCHKHSLRRMLNDAIYTNTPDKDTQAIRPDARAIRDNLDHHAAGGGPSSPANVASFQRFREFVKKKCDGRDIGSSVTELAPDMHVASEA